MLNRFDVDWQVFLISDYSKAMSELDFVVINIRVLTKPPLNEIF